MMIGCIGLRPFKQEHRTTIESFRMFCLDRISSGLVAVKDILNATFTLLPEYEICRSAGLAANGQSYDAVEDIDAFTELRKPVRRHR